MSPPTARPLVHALPLAALAGFVDGIGFVYLGGFFVSFMSGNTTQGAVSLVTDAAPAAALTALLIVGFVAGAALGAALSSPDRRSDIRILAVVVVLLSAGAAAAVVGIRPLAGALLAAGMGAVNTVFARGGRVPFGVTYMTGALMSMAQEIVGALRGGSRTRWLGHLALWTAIAAGALLGAVAYSTLGTVALWLPAVLLTLGIGMLSLRRRG